MMMMVMITNNKKSNNDDDGGNKNDTKIPMQNYKSDNHVGDNDGVITMTMMTAIIKPPNKLKKG